MVVSITDVRELFLDHVSTTDLEVLARVWTRVRSAQSTP